MKNYRMLTPFLFALLFFASFYMLLTGAAEDKAEVDLMIQKAESLQQQELYSKAADQYLELIKKTGDVQYYYRAIDMYYDAGVYDASDVWCEDGLKAFPKDPNLFDRRIRALIALEDYKEAYIVLDEFDSRRLQSAGVEEHRKTMKWAHYFNGVTYKDPSQFSAGYAAVMKKDLWGLVNAKGKVIVQPTYKAVGYFANELVAVCNADDEWFWMDKEGVLQYNISANIPGTITEVGLYNQDVAPVCVDGRYAYYDLNGKKLFGDYDYAGSFSQGVAAVKEGEAWHLIDNSGAVISKEPFTEIVMDERGICCQNERVFVKTNDSFRMLDLQMAYVGEMVYDQAHMFKGTSSLAAVKSGDTWQFVDANGQVKLEGKFEDAKSFNLGLAPVCVDGKWGYIDENGTMVIEAAFEECSEISSNGTAFCREDNSWDVLTLFEHNH